MTVTQILEQARELSLEERKELARALVDLLTEVPQPHEKRHSLREFRGVGAHLYDGTDAQEYVNRIRSEWDESP
ncbi:MAG: hypothetical protein SF123_24135 [Chloroflexota bacterium]|nr:hypothetical protein [Chloroflexota bacterium]